MSTTTANGRGAKVAVASDHLTRDEFIALAHAQGYGHLLQSEPTLPVGTLTEAIPYLRRPFTSSSVRWKIQSTWPKEGDPQMGQVVAYVDARLVVARLNLVCPHLWSERYEILALPGPADKGATKVKAWLTIAGVTREDVGVGRGAESFKAAHSDALKRVAVKFDVAQSVYSLPAIRMYAGNGAGKLPLKGKEKKSLRIEAEQLEFLRSRYETWLETDAGKTFGVPLDHGDALGAQGDPFDPDAPEDDEATEPLFEDDAPARSNGGRKISGARVEKLTALAAGMPPDSLLALLREVTGNPDLEDWLEGLKGLKGEQADAVEARIADGGGVGA